ncbi:hypothetical protein WBP07_02560 [Novosphingobium sp. BL-8A]|uniref:hypothetical protein n=1 Tax=Novosphingobium sp. BL-8A TaxID=3127639 RepID=UPI0037567421
MEEIFRKLNDPAVLPPLAFRRNHRHYELVSYVNCLLGCRISGNAVDAALFESRIEQFLASHPQTPEAASYYKLVADFVESEA